MLKIGTVFADLRAFESNEEFNSGSKTSQNSGLFFDSITERACSIRTEDNDTVFNVHSLNSQTAKTGQSHQQSLKGSFEFRTQELGRIRSVCLSPDFQLVAIQQEDTIVDLLHLSDSPNKTVLSEFRQTCAKGSIIWGVVWLLDRQIAFVTDAGCEFYLVNPQKRMLKSIKIMPLSVNWFSYYAPSKLFIFASGIPNNTLMCLCFQNNTAHNIGKFNIDFGQSPVKPRLYERDIAIGPIYGHVCLLALKFDSASGYPIALDVYEFPREMPMQMPKLAHTIRLDLVGMVGVQVLDNLVLVHHRNARTTLLFDLRISTDRPVHSAPLCLDQNLATHLRLHSRQKEPSEAETLSSQAAASFLYNSAWKMCPLGGFVLDMQLQIFTRLQLALDWLVKSEDAQEEATDRTMTPASKTPPRIFDDLEQTLQFLINRKDSEEQLLGLLQRAVLHSELKFTRLTQLFRQILQHPDAEQTSSSAQPQKSPLSAHFAPLALSHDSILHALFEPLSRHPDMNRQRLANLMLDFFMSIKQRGIKIEDQYTNELLLKILVDAKMWTCLQQLFQYRVIDDSKFLAFELIDRSAECPALYQVALDMLTRRGNTEYIPNVLAQKGYILDALRYINDEQFRHHHHHLGGADTSGDGIAGSVPLSTQDKLCLQLIEKAWLRSDRSLMYTVYTHLHATGRLKALADANNEDYERFSKEFSLLYGDKEVTEAEHRFRMARLSSIRRGRRWSEMVSAEDDEQMVDGERHNNHDGNVHAHARRHNQHAFTTSASAGNIRLPVEMDDDDDDDEKGEKEEGEGNDGMENAR